MNSSPAGTLSKADWKEWIVQTIIYSVLIPAGIVFLSSLQNGLDIKAAGIAAAYAIVSALVNLHAKFSAGVTNGTTN